MQGIQPVVSTNSSPTASLIRRYSDAYTEAHAVVGIGKIVKIVGVVLIVVILFAGLAMTGGQRGGGGLYVMIAFAFACLIGAPIYILGILVAAQGQTALATLDTAVNSSRHLTNDEVAVILSKRWSL